MINLDVAEFHIGVIEAAGYKSVPVDCAMMRELITRLRQAEKGAARYRWLRNCDTNQTERLVENGHIVGFGALDAMIDEAMQCSK